MSKAAALALAHLLITGPGGQSTCAPAGSSSERSLSDQPYDGPSANQCREADELQLTPRPRRVEEPLGNATTESSVDPARRAGFTMVGTGAALAVLGASFFACSRLSPIDYTRQYCRAVWPWTAGAGALVFASGLGVVGYSAWAAPEPSPRSAGLRLGLGATFAWDPQLRR